MSETEILTIFGLKIEVGAGERGHDPRSGYVTKWQPFVKYLI